MAALRSVGKIPAGNFSVKPIRGGFGLIHQPRTREEKLRHVEVLNSAPLEMEVALRERMAVKRGRLGKRSDPISHMLSKYQISPETELVDVMCRACATKEYCNSIWFEFESRTIELLPYLDAVDCGIILKCFGLRRESNAALELALLKRICDEASCSKEGLGMYTVLYALQHLQRTKGEFKLRSKYVGTLVKCLYGRGLGNLEFEFLVSVVQALAGNSLACPILVELESRISSSVEPEPDNLFGLLAAAAKFPPSATQDLFERSKKFIFAPGQFVLGFSIEKLSGLASAYARFGPGNAEVFASLGSELARCSIPEWTPRILAVTLNAFGTASVLHEDLLEAWTQVLPPLLNEMDGKQVAMCVFGCGKLGILKNFFPELKNACVSRHDFDLHSVSKILASITTEDSHMFSQILSKVEPLLHANPQPEDSESILSILSSISRMSARFDPPDQLHAKLFRILSSADLGHLKPDRVANVLVRFSTQGAAEDVDFHAFCRSAVCSLNSQTPLPDLVKVLHSISLCKSFPLAQTQVDLLLRLLRAKAADISLLGYRALNRLAASMARTGIVDEDISALLQESLQRRGMTGGLS